MTESIKIATVKCGKAKHEIHLNGTQVRTTCPSNEVKLELSAITLGSTPRGCAGFIHALRKHDLSACEAITYTKEGRSAIETRLALREEREKRRKVEPEKNRLKELRSVLLEWQKTVLTQESLIKVDGRFFDYDLAEGQGFPAELRLLVFIGGIPTVMPGWIKEQSQEPQRQQDLLIVSNSWVSMKQYMHGNLIILGEMPKDYWQNQRPLSEEPDYRPFWLRLIPREVAAAAHAKGCRLAAVTPSTPTEDRPFIVDLNDPSGVPYVGDSPELRAVPEPNKKSRAGKQKAGNP